MLNNGHGLDLVFRALADPTRRAILERLTRGPASVGELAAPMAMSLAAVMQHLEVLEGSRLIRSKKEGRVRICEIDRDVVARAEAWLSERRAQWEHQLDRLGDLLAQEAATPGKSRRRKK